MRLATPAAIAGRVVRLENASRFAWLCECVSFGIMARNSGLLRAAVPFRCSLKIGKAGDNVPVRQFIKIRFDHGRVDV